jgi:hypothetical protein
MAIEREFSKAKLLHSDWRKSLILDRLAGIALLRETIDLVYLLDGSSDVAGELEESIIVFSDDGNEMNEL